MHKERILIDFDRTISPIHGFSKPPDDDAIQAITILATKYTISIYSCRANKEVCKESDYIQLIEYLKTYAIPYDDIILDKPVYTAIIDDRAFNPAITSWKQITEELIGRF